MLYSLPPRSRTVATTSTGAWREARPKNFFGVPRGPKCITGSSDVRCFSCAKLGIIVQRINFRYTPTAEPTSRTNIIKAWQ